jgi:hypothetical protein
MVALFGWLVYELNRRTGVIALQTATAVTEQKRQIVLGSAKTMAGHLNAAIAAGKLSLNDIHDQDNPIVWKAAQAAVNAVPEASKALQVGPADLVRIAAGIVGNSLKPTAHAVTLSAVLPGRTA